METIVATHSSRTYEYYSLAIDGEMSMTCMFLLYMIWYVTHQVNAVITEL